MLIGPNIQTQPTRTLAQLSLKIGAGFIFQAQKKIEINKNKY